MKRFYLVGIIGALFATCDANGDLAFEYPLCSTLMDASPGLTEECTTGGVTYDANCYTNGIDQCCTNYQGLVSIENEYGIVTVTGEYSMVGTRVGTCKISCSCEPLAAQYACAKNKFGNPTSATDAGACQPCPGDGQTRLMYGAKSITECYLPAGNIYTDTSGTYTHTEDCYYVTD